MTNSRRIGKDAELEGAGRLNALFGTSFYRSQQHKGAVDAPDIIDDNFPGLAVEVKRRKELSKRLHDFVNQARDEAHADATAFLIHRKPGQRWLLTVDLFEAPELILRLASALARSMSEDALAGALDSLVVEARLTQADVELDGIDGRRREKAARKKGGSK